MGIRAPFPSPFPCRGIVMATTAAPAAPGRWTELGNLVRRAGLAWRLISRPPRVTFVVAMGLMAVTGTLTTAIPVLIGWMVNNLEPGLTPGPPVDILPRAALFLGVVGLVYLARELLLISQKYVVQRACSRIEK